MSDSHSAFTGNIPENYDKYLGPLIFREYANDIATRVALRDNGLVLETAAGSGMATRQLRSALNSNVKMIVTDLNSDMLDLAKAKFTDDENIEFRVANALELPFAESTFDLAVCQFSLMFFPDKLASLKEAARVLKPDGKIFFNVWDSLEVNHFAQTVSSHIAKHYAKDAPDFFSTPFGYFDIQVIRNLLSEANFKHIEISVIPGVSSANSARDVARGFILGTPVRLQIEAEGTDTPSDIADAVERELINEYGSGSISANMQAIVFEASL